MFGIDIFNYGNVVQFKGENDYRTIDDYEGIKYWCIEGEYKDDGSGTKRLWVNGISDVKPPQGKNINDRLNQETPHGGRYEESIREVFDYDEDWVEDCTKAKQTVDEQNAGENESKNCSDTNQETKDDGTCGECLDGYVLNDDDSSSDYGKCVEDEEEESDNLILYGSLIGVVGLVVIMGIMRKG
tara:strand:- start:34904 stop:35458 length:555 start_codon:yes stop_codon:yes gene_type:complete